MEEYENCSRRKVKRKKTVRRRNRKVLRWTTAFFALVVVIAGVFALCMTTLFQTKSIVVEGETRYSHEEIIRISGLELDINIFSNDCDLAESVLKEELVYLGNVDVSIRLPDQIVITVRETVPMIAFETQSGFLLVDENNKALEEVSSLSEEMYADLKVVKNAKIEGAVFGKSVEYSDKKTWDVLSNVLDAVKEGGLDNVSEIDLKNIYSVQIYYGELYWIKLGTTNELERKIELAKYVIENKLDGEHPGFLDVSSENGSAVFKEDFDSIGVIIPPEKDADSGEN